MGWFLNQVYISSGHSIGLKAHHVAQHGVLTHPSPMLRSSLGGPLLPEGPPQSERVTEALHGNTRLFPWRDRCVAQKWIQGQNGRCIRRSTAAEWTVPVLPPRQTCQSCSQHETMSSELGRCAATARVCHRIGFVKIWK